MCARFGLYPYLWRQASSDRLTRRPCKRLAVAAIADSTQAGTMQERLLDWCRSFAPVPLSARPAEWLRAATGMGLALLVIIPFSAWVFGIAVTLPLAAPALLPSTALSTDAP